MSLHLVAMSHSLCMSLSACALFIHMYVKQKNNLFIKILSLHRQKAALHPYQHAPWCPVTEVLGKLHTYMHVPSATVDILFASAYLNNVTANMLRSSSGRR